jgi:hypothetical protein
MIQGLRTVIYKVDDIIQARDWYSRALGIEPYYDQPYYVGFSVAGYELGLDPDVSRSKPGPRVARWPHGALPTSKRSFVISRLSGQLARAQFKT